MAGRKGPAPPAMRDAIMRDYAQQQAIRRVERAAAELAAARAELETAMRDASAAGVSLRPIAAAADLSVEWTRRTIARTS